MPRRVDTNLKQLHDVDSHHHLAPRQFQALCIVGDRRLRADAMAAPGSITVLGGGISGLSAAFHLCRRFPPRSGTRITLVEGAPRLGGWVRSERVRVSDNKRRQADILLESGPRTLRPNSKAILELVSVSLVYGIPVSWNWDSTGPVAIDTSTAPSRPGIFIPVYE